MRPLGRLAVWLHERSLAAEEREAVVGDLLEEFESRSSVSRLAAAGWLWAQTFRSVVPNLARRRRIRAARHSPFHSTGAGLMNPILMDLRFTLRLMRRQPFVTAVAFTSLLTGLALNLLLFTISNAVLFRPLALTDPATLFVLLLQRPSNLMHNFSYPDYVLLRDTARLPRGIVAYSPIDATWKSSESAEIVEGELVSGNMFAVLGVPITLGRGLAVTDDDPAAPPAIVVSEALWKKASGSAVLNGQVLTLNGQAFTVAGVVDGSFTGMQLGRDAAFWAPIAQARLLGQDDILRRPDTSWLTLMVRVPSPAAGEAVRQELDGMLKPAFESRGRSYEPVVLEEGARGDSMLPAALASPLSILSVAAMLLLLVACMNAANLQLARAEARRLEFAVRAALGARRSQLVRLVLSDALLLSLAAGAAAMVVVWSLKDRAASLIALFGRPVSLAVPIDFRVLAVTVTLSVISGLVVGLFATWQTVRPQPADTLTDARSATRGRRRTQQALVVAQFALSMAVLTGATLLVRTLMNLRGTDLGFDVRQLALLEVSPAAANLQGAAASQYFQLVVDAVRSSPGVDAASIAHVMPLDFGGSRTTVDVQGYSASPGEEMELNFLRVTPDYFSTLGIRVKQGRGFTIGDGPTQPRRVVVNETMARRFWPNSDPIGRFIRFDTDGPFDVEVIGVVPDVHYRMVRESPRPSFYASLLQWPAASGAVHVRTAGDPAPRLQELRRQVASVNPAVPVGRVLTLGEQLERNIARERMSSAIGVTLAAATLLLATAGLYSTMAFLVGRRTREIGVRVALGARGADVGRIVLGEATRLVCSGAVVGLALAFWAGRTLDTLLFGVSASDPMSAIAAAALMAAAGLLASWIPARRAARVDPVVALREP